MEIVGLRAKVTEIRFNCGTLLEFSTSNAVKTVALDHGGGDFLAEENVLKRTFN